MAEVTGRIGQEDVELNNAATEATLRLLLQSSLSGNRQTLQGIQNIAAASGLINRNTAAQINQQTQQQATVLQRVNLASGQVATGLTNASAVISQLTAGTGNASNALNTLSILLPERLAALGTFVKGISVMLEYQENLLKSYQEISNAGVSFSGSLTDMRLAAAKTYMTLDEFTNIIKNNGTSLVKMGGTADQGARAFVRLSNDILKSDIGNNLRSLGYTTAEINQSMLTYISNTGGRSREELKNTDNLKKSTVSYLYELDELSRLTGKNRQEIEKKAQEAAQEAEFQLFLSTKSAKEREVITASVVRQATLYGKGGEDIAKANAMGIAVYGEAGKILTATSAGAAEAMRNDLDLRRRYGDRSKQVQDNEMQGRDSNVVSMQRLAGAVASVSGILKPIPEATLLAARDGVAGQKAITDQYTDIAVERAKIEDSQAKSAVKTQQAIQDLGIVILDRLMPIVSALWKVLNPLVTTVSNVLSWMGKMPGLLEGFGVALLFLTAKSLAAGTGISAGGIAGAAKNASGRSRFGVGAGAVAAGLGYAGQSYFGADTSMGMASGILGSAATGATLGSLAGPLGIAIGGLLGAGYGAYQAGLIPKMANGGIVTKPTYIQAGESGSEAIVPLTQFDKLQDELRILNKQMSDMIRYTKESVDYSRQNVNATKSLSGNLF